MADDQIDNSVDADEFDPSKKLKKSAAFLKLIADYRKAGFQSYSDKSDNIEKRYADLERLASVGRDREFSIFWANIQVLGPSIYSRPPVPVVIPRFRGDRKPIPRMASELLERCAIVGFELEDIDGVMRMVRDDLSILARGAPWVRYETKTKDGKFRERVCIDHVNRKDFAHDPARSWKEVDWVAKRSWLTKSEMRKRFSKTSGNAYQDADYAIRRDERQNSSGRQKAGVWEIWLKTANRVVWVTEGVEVLLDDDEPHLTLDGFFPCPKPAYGTVQRNSMIPVPDYVQYKDQIEEINEITARISSLAESVRVKGFYPAGASDIGDAIEAALKNVENRSILVPVANWAAFGELGSNPIIWLPLEVIGTVIVQLVNLRRQLIQDVYEITGLSDIMRGMSNANETLGAQELKSQYGSVRIRDRQDEMVRVARDLTRIMCEIMAENFQKKTLLEMSQLDIANDADIKKQVSALEKQVKAIQAQIKEAQSDPEIQAQAQQKPEIAQQVLQQAEQQIQQLVGQINELNETVTIEKVMELLREQRVRPFVLDIETDSTVTPDENAQKQRATEFTTAVGGFLTQALTAVQHVPQSAPLMAETLRYVASQFRAGRQLDGVIDEFAEQMKQIAAQPKQGDEAAKAAQAAAQAEAQSKQMDEKRKQDAFVRDTQIKGQLADHEAKMREFEAGEKVKAIQLDAAQKAQKHRQDMELGQLDIRKKELEIEKLGGQIVVQNDKAAIDAANAATGAVVEVSA